MFIHLWTRKTAGYEWTTPARLHGLHDGGVTHDVELLGRLVALAALIGATIEYAEILRRRVERRRRAADIADSQAAGLRGLVRVFLSEESR